MFISHGGMNGVSESMYYLVPMVLLPKTVEQELNAVLVLCPHFFFLFISILLFFSALFDTSADSVIRIFMYSCIRPECRRWERD